MRKERNKLKNIACSVALGCAILALTPVVGFATEADEPAENETEYVSVERKLYDAESADFTYTVDSSGYATITGYTGSAAEVTIPAKIGDYTVKSIQYRAFKGNTNITKVVISEGITSIGYEAFEDCTSLMDVTIPSTITAIGSTSTSYGGVFENCLSLSNVTIKKGSTESYIGTYTFKNCDNLISVSIPGNYKTLYYQSFYDCDSLSSFTLQTSELDIKQSINVSAFYSCDKLKTLSLPTTLQTIQNSAFRDCVALRNLTIPEGVTTIEYAAFYNCKALISVSLPSTLTALGSTYSSYSGVFENCKGLSTVTMKNGTEDMYIGTFTFKECASLSTINIPTNCTRIYYQAFYDCILLNNVSASNTNLTSVDVQAFYNCTSIKALTLPTTLTSIGNEAFCNCKSILEVTIPEGTKTIGYLAFYGCESLKTVSIPSTMTSLGSTSTSYGGVFENCTSLTTVTFADGTVGAYIGPYAFKNTGITSVTIPGNYRTIYYEAFRDCKSLKALVYKKDSVVYASQIIGKSAFYNTGLTSISLSTSLKTIGTTAFYNCTSLVDLVIPEGVETINYGAFWNCTSLTNVSLPSTLEALGATSSYSEGAFQNCTSLSQVKWEAGETDAYVGRNCFYKCESLKTITIPGNVETIYAYAFQECTSLEQFIIEKGLYAYANQSINGYAFYKDAALVSVYLPSTVGSIDSNAFYNCGDFTMYGSTGSAASTYASTRDNITFEVYNEDAKFSTDSTGYEYIGSAIVLKAEGGVSYKFSVFNPETNVEVTIKDYSEEDTYTWRPTTAGTKIIYAYVKDSTGSEVKLQEAVIVKEGLKVTGKAAESTIEAGATVILSATATGGSGGYTYKYLVYVDSTSSWYTLKDYTDNTSHTTNGIAGSGTKQFRIEAKDSEGNTATSEIIKVKINAPVTPLSGTLKVGKSTAAFSKMVGDSVVFTAAGAGGTGGYTYKWAVYDETSKTWVILRNFSTDNSYSCTFKSAGKKIFAVTVKDSEGNTAATNRITVTVANKTEALTGTLKVGTSTDALTKSVGDTIVLTAAGAGGTGGYTYKFAICDDATNRWTVLRDFNSQGTYSYTFAEAGRRSFAVTVKDSAGTTVATNRISAIISNITPLSGTLKAGTSTADFTSTVGNTVVFTATGAGGTGGYTYKWAVYDEATNKWVVLRNFNAESTYSCTFKGSGKKIFAVTVKDNSGTTVATNRITATVNNKAAALTGTLKAGTSTADFTTTVGDTVVFTAAGAGGAGGYTYKWAVYDEATNKWVVLRNFNAESTYSCTFKGAGKKIFAVTVKDSNGTTVATNRVTATVNNKSVALTGTLKVGTSTADLTKTVGDTVVFTAAGAGGASGYTYKWAVYDEATNKWVVLRNFSTDNTYSCTLKSAGKKIFAVTVKDSNGATAATNRITVTVNEKTTASDMIAILMADGSTTSLSKKVGDTVILNTIAAGGSGSYTYQYRVYNVDTKTWFTLKDYSSSSAYATSLAGAGNKEFVVSVKDSNGNIVSTNKIAVNVSK